MGHYDEYYVYQTKREYEIKNLKSRLINELSVDEMIKIMFKDFIEEQLNLRIESLSNKYLK